MIAEDLKNEINRNFHAKIESLTTTLENKTNSAIEQLSFQISSYYEIIHDEKFKCSTKLLHKGDDDYKFILRSIDNKSTKNTLKILQLFRINPTDKNEDINFKQKYLYLNGVKADQLKYILTNGYPNDLSSLKELNPLLYKTTTNLRLATCVGSNYCKVYNTVKKLSFVFVVCSKENYKDQKNYKLIEDSRKSVTREGKFSYFEYWSDKNRLDSVPAYLIVFELDDL